MASDGVRNGLPTVAHELRAQLQCRLPIGRLHVSELRLILLTSTPSGLRAFSIPFYASSSQLSVSTGARSQHRLVCAEVVLLCMIPMTGVLTPHPPPLMRSPAVSLTANAQTWA